MSILRVAANFLAKTETLKHLKRLNKVLFSDKYLFYTNVTISLSLSTAGDLIEQRLELYSDQIEQISYLRTGRMAISGATVGVICHFWYKILDKYLPGRSLRIVTQKILLDQFICSPLYISVFFITLAVLEDKSVDEIWEEIRHKAWRLYAADWVVWPVAQFVNFFWLPLRYRVFYDNFISLGYDVYTSHVKHTKIV